jgi:hypothetical protein
VRVGIKRSVPDELCRGDTFELASLTLKTSPCMALVAFERSFCSPISFQNYPDKLSCFFQENPVTVY